jgi:hypothetical protein
MMVITIHLHLHLHPSPLPSRGGAIALACVLIPCLMHGSDHPLPLRLRTRLGPRIHHSHCSGQGGLPGDRPPLLRTDGGPENGNAKTPPHSRTSRSRSLATGAAPTVGRLHANVSANDKPSVFLISGPLVLSGSYHPSWCGYFVC